jgi:hypothetical protein
MSGLWYCPSCGYEVDRGGRCHNCKQPLVETHLDELAPDQSDDEVGYRLDEWEDAARGQLIELLVDRRIRHRFEGDELVVSGADEQVVDELVDQLTSGAGEDADVESDQEAADEATVATLEALYDASRRLRTDPTDMTADTDLAEASAQVFAMDGVYGVDSETLAAIGRVTRRLLGALGAEEALEDEITKQATILCRLLEPIVAPQDTESVPWETQSNMPFLGSAASGTRYLPPDPVETEADDVVDGDDEEGAGGEGDHDELVYELDDWLPEERAQLGLLLDGQGIPHSWEGTDLVIPEADEQVVEPLFDQVERSGTSELPEDAEGGDDEREYQILSELFGAADRLVGDPGDKNKRRDYVDAAAAVAGSGAPFGVSDQDWWQVKTRAQAVSDSIDLDADLDVVADGAATLRDLLRGFL